MADLHIQHEAKAVGITADRSQPHSDAVERSVLSAILRDPVSCLGQAAEVFGPEPDIFYQAVHREIYLVMRQLADDDKAAIDLLSVAHKLQERGKLEAVGGEAFLAELEMAAPATVNFEAWCIILRKYAMLRRMIGVCSGALVKCYDNEVDADKLVDEIESDIYDIRNAESRASIQDIYQAVREEMAELQKIWTKQAEVGIPTGFAQLDDYTGGLKPGEMFVLAARPSIGKTALALNVIRNVALHKENPRCVAFFSLEMTTGQIVRRLISTLADIPEYKFRSREFFQSGDMVRLTKACSELSEAKLFIDPTGGLTISELRAKARRLRQQERVDLVVIDYLQLMHTDGRAESRQNEVSEISGGIKKLAKDLQIPVLVLAQLNREVDKTAGNKPMRPKLAHLRESGSIEQDADVVTFLHRDRDETKNVNEGVSVEAEWIVEKNRNGRTGSIKLLFFPSRMEFMPAAPCKEEFGPGHGTGN